MRLAIFQLAPVLRDPAHNGGRIAATAAETAADLLVTPELSLTGYDLGDDAAYLAAPVRPLGPPDFAPALAQAPDVVVGLPELGEDGVVYNSVVHVAGGQVLHNYRKRYLPTYGMFDEARWFGRGSRLDAYRWRGWTVGQLICEDFWHPALPYLLGVRGVQLLLVSSAAPGRGVLGATGDALFSSTATWERMARMTAQLHGIYVALANRVGVEGAVTFAGGSLIAGPDGEVLAHAPEGREALIEAEISLDELARNRRPYAHVRDDEPAWVLDQLRQALEDAR